MNVKAWIFPILAAVAGALVSLYYYADLPDQIAIHFGPNDQPDRWASKPVGAFLAPALILAFQTLITLSIRWQSDAKRRRLLANGHTTITYVFSALLLAVHLFTIAYSLGQPVSPSLFVPVAVGVVFIGIGNIIPRLPQRRMLFLRLPEQVYARYARYQGRLMVAAGFLMLLAVTFPLGIRPYLILGVLAAFIAASLIGLLAAVRGSRD